MNNKVVIIGCGNVGLSCAYALINGNSNVDSLVLIDIKREKLLGEVMDLNHAIPSTNSNISVTIGDYSDCKDAKVVVICAGLNQKPGETRLDLMNKNKDLIKEITNKVMESGFNGIFIVATNPVDIMSYIVYKESKLSSSKVIGSGTVLDSSRLKYLLSQKLNISHKNIDAVVVGEHGDSEFIPWSIINIANTPATELLTKDEMERLEKTVRNAAYEIINRKGATYYGIGSSLALIINTIINNESKVLTVSILDEKNKVYLSVPSIVNKNGVIKSLPLYLTKEEYAKYSNSINVIKENINKINY